MNSELAAACSFFPERIPGTAMQRLPRLFQDGEGIQLSDLSGLSDIHAANGPRQSRGCGEDPFPLCLCSGQFSHLTRKGGEQGLRYVKKGCRLPRYSPGQGGGGVMVRV